MLTAIRKPYLNLDSRTTPFARQQPRTINLSDAEQSWANIRHLSDKERDQIDLQARVILSRCSDRVKAMEALEKRMPFLRFTTNSVLNLICSAYTGRQEIAASNTNPLTRFLPARLRQDEATAASDFVAAHHASITWYLSRRLTETSQALKDLQEERMKRQLERTRTLGSGAAREAMFMTDPLPSSSSSSDTGSGNNGSGSGSYNGAGGSGWLGGASNLASSFLGGDPSSSSSRSTPRTARRCASCRRRMDSCRARSLGPTGSRHLIGGRPAKGSPTS